MYKVHTVFSREVRDMIYSELHAEDHSHLMDDFCFSALDRAVLPHNRPLDSLDLLPLNGKVPFTEDYLSPQGRDVYRRVYFNKNIVGAAAAQEIVEAWYKRATFSHVSMKAMSYHGYLRVDRWGLGLRPAHLLRYITLEIQEDRIRDFRFSAPAGSVHYAKFADPETSTSRFIPAVIVTVTGIVWDAVEISCLARETSKTSSHRENICSGR